MTEAQLNDFLRHCLFSVDSRLDASSVTLDMSLTQDLGLDSLRLASFFDLLGRELEVDFTPWFMRATRRGSDSLSDLALFLSESARADKGLARAGGAR